MNSVRPPAGVPVAARGGVDGQGAAVEVGQDGLRGDGVARGLLDDLRAGCRVRRDAGAVRHRVPRPRLPPHHKHIDLLSAHFAFLAFESHKSQPGVCMSAIT